MQLNRSLPILSTEPFLFDPKQQDRGFAQMLQQEIEVKQAVVDTQNGMQPNQAETQLLQRWPISEYARIFSEAEKVLTETEADFERFHERSRQIAYDLMRYDMQAMVDVRFGVAGISTTPNEPFMLSDAYLQRLWQAEGPMQNWGRDNSRLTQAITGLGVKHALAKAVISLQEEHGVDRYQATARGQLDSYVRHVLLRAGNLTGFNPLSSHQLETIGCDLRCTLSVEDFDPRQATAAELRGAAQHLFHRREIGVESLSLLTHAPQLLSPQAPQGGVNWIDTFRGFVNSAQVQGKAQFHLENTLAVLQRQAG